MLFDIQAYPSRDGTLFTHLQPEQVADVVARFEDPGRSKVLRYRSMLGQLEQAGAKGILADFPAMAGANAVQVRGGGERSWKHVEVPDTVGRAEPRTFQPFPDEFVSALVGRALWIHRNLADDVIACWARILKHVDRSGKIGEGLYIDLVAERAWQDAEGRKIKALPFDVVRHGASSRAWPPRDAEEFRRFVEIIQGLNIHLVAFCTGARQSEVGSATSGSIKFRPDGTADYEALTYKLTQRVEGEVRDWPLHPAGVAALRFQVKLASLVRPSGAEHMWFNLAQGDSFGRPVFELTSYAIRTVTRLGLNKLALSEEALRRERSAGQGGTAVVREHAHLHRWRKTVARIVALTTVGAPQILVDLFGHRDIGMTLKYMLADRNLAQDARKLAEERTVAMAEAALKDVAAGASSGRATERLRSRLASDEGRKAVEAADATPTGEEMRHSQTAYGQSRLDVMARTLTAHGKFWRLVRPGVICTKVAGEFGPCNRGRGEPDAGGCQAACIHRLETAAAKAQCRQALDALLVEHAAAVTRGLTMLVANLEEQVRENLRRWDDVRDELVATSSAAREIWHGAAA